MGKKHHKEEKKSNIKLYVGIAVVIILLVLLFMKMKQAPTETGAETPTGPEATEPEVPTTQAPIVPAPEVDIKKKTAEERELSGGSKDMISDIGCDLSELRITFTLTNVEEEEKVLERITQFGDASQALKVSINGKHIRDLPAACGGKTTLGPKETVQCQMQFESSEEIHNYGIKSGESYEGFTTEEKKNRISARTLEFTDETYFGCI